MSFKTNLEMNFQKNMQESILLKNNFQSHFYN